VGVRRGSRLAGGFTPPGDKSVTHRALLFGLLADGETRVLEANPGEDCDRSARAAAALGANVERVGGGWSVRGTAGELAEPGGALDCGNSGTTLRLLAGIVARAPFSVRLEGDESLSRRPMRRIAEPLERMGAMVEGRGEACTPPLRVSGGALRGIRHDLPMASAQVATCVLLAGLAASGETCVRLPGPARDHTERMLPAFGVPLEVEPLAGGGRSVTVRGGITPRGATLRVPGDFSAAAFLLAAAAATPGASVTARRVSLNPTRTGFLDVLREMGAGVEVREEPAGAAAGEPAGDVTVTGPERLRAFDVPPAWVPRLVDEAPAWAVVASHAGGISRLRGAGELRVKESDRIAALAEGLRATGIACEEFPDGLAVHGGRAHGGGRIATRGDHRIAMAFAALASRLDEPLWLDDVASVPTSDPGYLATLAALGAEVIGGPGPERAA
jgi:3-phosphoshikimate 1-carboxyvinyltransferase